MQYGDVNIKIHDMDVFVKNTKYFKKPIPIKTFYGRIYEMENSHDVLEGDDFLNKVRIGVVGVGRGSSMIRFCETAENAEVVAICDKWEEGLKRKKGELKDARITYYTSYDEFILHPGMDAVVLANYATEHAPFAIKAMKQGLHVFSEVLPCQTLSEAVALVETVESTGQIYAYGENYCFMPSPKEMRILYKEGKLGELEYAEGEYVHNCESIWPEITYGERDHWRNYMHAFFYCTHSIGPIIHITGLRPVRVVGFEIPFNKRSERMGKRSGIAGVEMLTLENGAVVKSIHGDLIKNSIWYCLYGTKGRMESSREDAENGCVMRLHTNLNPDAENLYPDNCQTYEPTDALSKAAQSYGHGAADFYTMYYFTRKILGDETAEVIDVYEALDMSLPGIMAYRSVLNGGIPMAIPNLRIKEERDKYRNDRICTSRSVAGDQYVPPCSKGEMPVPQENYDKIKEKWEAMLKQ